MKLTSTSIIPVSEDGTVTLYSITKDTVDTEKGTVCLDTDDIVRLYEHQLEKMGGYEKDIDFFDDLESAREAFSAQTVREHHSGECEIFFLRCWNLSGIEAESITLDSWIEYYDDFDDIDIKSDTIYVSKEIAVVENDHHRFCFSSFDEAMSLAGDEEEDLDGKVTVSEYDVPVFHLNQEPEDIWEIAMQRAPSRVILLRCEEVCQ